MNTKVVNADDLAATSCALRAEGRKLVLTNGCFDLLHVGHVRYLKAARALGDALAVAINGDESVRALKGEGRPLIPEAQRAEIVAALESVNYVVIFPELRATALIEKIQPAIYVKGGDYTAETLNADERTALDKVGAEIRIVPFETGHSTSGLIDKMKERPSAEMKNRLAIGILGSGKGSNCRAILEQIRDGKLKVDPRIIVSDVFDAGILDIAREFGVPSAYHPSEKFRTRYEPAVEIQLVKMLKGAGVDLVVLAGFMRVLKEPMLTAFPRRIINLHPSLLPKFPGLEAWRQALAAGEKETGCTVHFVDAGVDTGDIIAQRKVRILANDTVESLHARIQVVERAALSGSYQAIQ